MIKIIENYLQNYKMRSNTIVISEVFCAFVLDKYILPKNILIVGEKPSKNLPDIYTKDKTLGFEITTCEADEDYKHKDITKELNKIDFEYDKFVELCSNPSSPFSDKRLKVTTNGNKITSSMMTGFFHKVDWMLSKYKLSIRKKLVKLNSGHYSDCGEISLIILSTARALNITDAQILQKALIEENDNFKINFNNVYFFTTDDIFLIDSKAIKTIHHYINNEYSDLVNKMKKTLKIHQFKGE